MLIGVQLPSQVALAPAAIAPAKPIDEQITRLEPVLRRIEAGPPAL